MFLCIKLLNGTMVGYFTSAWHVIFSVSIGWGLGQIQCSYWDFMILYSTGSTLFSTSPGLLTSHHFQMMQQQNALLQQLRQQQQQQQQHHIIQGGSLASPQSSAAVGSNVITSRTTANPIQNSITTGGGLVMTASGHGFQHGYHIAGSDSPLRSSSSGVNRIRAPISHIPSGNPTFQDIRIMPHLTAIGRNEHSQSTNKSLLQGKQSLNSGTSTPRQHFPSQQVTWPQWRDHVRLIWDHVTLSCDFYDSLFLVFLSRFEQNDRLISHYIISLGIPPSGPSKSSCTVQRESNAQCW